MIENYTAETVAHSPYTTLLFNQHTPPHTHFFWEFTYSVNGTVINYVNGEPVECHPLSKIILIKPGVTHEMLPAEQSVSAVPLQHRDIYVTVDKMKKLCAMLDKNLYAMLSESPVTVIDTKNENMESLEQTLNYFNIYESSFSSHMDLFDQLHTTVVFQILGILLKHKICQKRQYPDWIENFFDNLKTESFLCRDIQDIIRDIHYSHGYICREFKKNVGKTMVQCLNESRVAYSTLLLMDNSLSVLDIAMRLNYNSQSAFINAFKKVYRVSPNQWRIRVFEANRS